MIINCDAKQLEWVCAVYLSQDQVGIKEILAKEDIHENNRKDFKLPSRLVSKTYLFRLIFGGQAYSYAHDPDFRDVSTSEKYWQTVIDRTYDKYKGLGQWHKELMREVVNTGRLVMPTGRVYIFNPREMDLLRTKILNYPVQGLGAEIMSIARVSLYRRMKSLNLKTLLICTVHDSIVTDGPSNEKDIVVGLMFDVFDDIPLNFKRVFGVEFNLPLRCEVSYGDNWGEMQEITKES